MMGHMGYGQERLKDILEKEAEGEEPAAAKEKEETKEQRQGPAAPKEQQQDDVAKIKLVYEGKRVKQFRMTRNLNKSNTKMIMTNITPHIEMRKKVIY